MMVCSKRPQHFCDTLVKAAMGPTTTQLSQSLIHSRKHSTFPCLHCAHCVSVLKGDARQHPKTGTKISLKGIVLVHHLLDLSKCLCGLIYVGETSQRIKDRIASHKSTIGCLPIQNNFIEAKHSVSQLWFQLTEQVPRPTHGDNHLTILKNCELYWIHHHNSLTPEDLNSECDLFIT